MANYSSNTVSVIDGATGTVVGSPISVGSGPYAVAVNPTTNKIYVANFGGNTVSVIDGATGLVIGSPIAVGSGPYAVAVNPTTNKIYVANTTDSTVSIIQDDPPVTNTPASSSWSLALFALAALVIAVGVRRHKISSLA